MGRKLTSQSAVTLTNVSGPGCNGIGGAVCSTRRWEYDEVGNVTKEIIPTGNGSSQGEVSRSYTYDKVQRLKTQQDELNRTWSYTYDANGNKLTVTDPLNRTTTWTYDSGDRATAVTDPLTHTAQTAYDVWDGVISTTDPTNRTTSFHYDKAGRLTSVTDPLNHASFLQYDKNGNRTALSDPRGKTQTVTYDALDRPIQSQSAAATATVCNPGCSTTTAVRTASATYALDGPVLTETDFNGQTRSYSYDSARRLQQIDHPGATPDPSFSWNKLGQRTSLKENGSTVATYSYDEWGRLLAETRGSSTVQYRYDRRHQIGMSYPDGKVVESYYDAAGQLAYQDDWRGSGSGRTNYTYDGAGRRIGRTQPSGISTSWTYDAGDRLTEVLHFRAANGGILFRANATYDQAGRRLTQTDFDPARVGGSGAGTPNTLAPTRIGSGSGSPNVLAPARLPGTIAPGSPSSLAPNRIGSQPATTVQTFTYDGAGRLTSEARDGFSAISWTYDDAGNRTSQSSAGQTTSYVYDDDNRLLSTTTGSNVTTFSYDPNGSLLERSGTGETLLYGWDTAGRLTSITRNGSTQASFAYDGDGNRRSKTSNGQTTTYVNDARGLAQVLQAIGPSSTVTYVGNAQYDSSKPTETEKWGYTLSDAQNAKLLVDNAGNLAHRWEWEPFGRARADTGNTAAAFSFSGEQRDDETGLINLRARYYDPGIGRFLSRDSIPGVMTLPQSWNRFSYVENDPINATDPSGHKKSTKIKYPMGMDPDDDSHQRKKARACKNPGQYTGSCKGGPPNAAYNADGEAQHEAKKAGQAFAAGNLATGMAHLQASMHFASTAGTAAAHTAAAQASASLWAAYQAIHGAWSADRNGDGDFMLSMKQLAGDDDQADPEEVNSWYYWDVPSGVPWGELHTRVQFMWGVRVGYGEETAMALWTYLVGTNNPWDWKKDFPEDSPERQPAADVGNFMYGATAAAAGWQTLGEVRRGAGAAQWLDNQRRSPPKPSSGTPWDLNPLSCYGDRCRDQRYVVNGWFWYQSHVAGKEFMPSSLPGQLTPIMH